MHGVRTQTKFAGMFKLDFRTTKAHAVEGKIYFHNLTLYGNLKWKKIFFHPEYFTQNIYPNPKLQETSNTFLNIRLAMLLPREMVEALHF